MEQSFPKPSTIRLKPFRISKKEYVGFWALQVKRRSDWWAVFSVNDSEEVWPFVCYGVTPKDKRAFVPLEEYPLLHAVAGNFIHNVDEKGGRFFINRQGVFFIKGEGETSESRPEQFIVWNPDKPLPDKRIESANNGVPLQNFISFAELRKMQKPH